MRTKSHQGVRRAVDGGAWQRGRPRAVLKRKSPLFGSAATASRGRFWRGPRAMGCCCVEEAKLATSSSLTGPKKRRDSFFPARNPAGKKVNVDVGCEGQKDAKTGALCSTTERVKLQLSLLFQRRTDRRRTAEEPRNNALFGFVPRKLMNIATPHHTPQHTPQHTTPSTPCTLAAASLHQQQTSVNCSCGFEEQTHFVPKSQRARSLLTTHHSPLTIIHIHTRWQLISPTFSHHLHIPSTNVNLTRLFAAARAAQFTAAQPDFATARPSQPPPKQCASLSS